MVDKGSPLLPFFLAPFAGSGAVTKRLCSGLQIRVARFDSGPRLHHSILCIATLSIADSERPHCAWRQKDLHYEPSAARTSARAAARPRWTCQAIAIGSDAPATQWNQSVHWRNAAPPK